jgi:hypothetical protein
MIDVPPDLYELYAEFGYASEKAQVLEVAAGNVALAYLALFTDTDNITPEQIKFFRQIVDGHQFQDLWCPTQKYQETWHYWR